MDYCDAALIRYHTGNSTNYISRDHEQIKTLPILPGFLAVTEVSFAEKSQETPAASAPMRSMADWSPDIGREILIMGAGLRSAIGTLVERVTRYTLLVKLEFKDTDYTCISFANAINNYPELLRRSMTYDQGKYSTGTHRRWSSTNLLH